MSTQPSHICTAVLKAVAIAIAAASPAKADGAPVTPVVDPKANFHETGRFGVLGALTEDMWKGGAVYEHEHFEVQLLAHAGFEGKHDRDVHLIAKVGGRIPLGTLNYLALGGEVGTHVGSKEADKALNGGYTVGPYVSLQRYFAATPVMLNLWVNPVRFDRVATVDSTGEKTAYNAYRVFQAGGFGIAYLF